ncbi:uncharacterized protein LOC131291382 [Anopheles ziemanni]|uniref:uncharacterized protein LOC131262358 n=1 Tax=Anopheles coustani TaxID=139045 RepID=UPI00265907DD|nr:uncharacterized protein LOC131262358 [Anopheles coustani]XP_058176571.1 uncharacterized protein LOC131291382 [Anopheles ziemanni]
MVNLCNLLVKYSHFSKVDDDVFVYIDRILENAYEIHNKQHKAKIEIDYLNKQLEEKRHRTAEIAERSPSKALAKKRKVRSVDASYSELKENISVLEDSRIIAYKSDPETSTTAASILEQNIIDSEESFFALTQSPPRKDLPECLNTSASEQTAQQAMNTCSTNVSKPLGNILRASRLSNEFPSPDPALRMEQKSTGSSTPKGASGKWTSKKQNVTKGTPKTEQTPVTLKRFHSLLEGNRLRQTKLYFADPEKPSVKKTVAELSTSDETLMNDFVIPTPPSASNRSKFLRSLRMKKQSTLIEGAAGQDRPVQRSNTMVNESKMKGGNPQTANDDDYDIDQTFCSGAEIKKEPMTQPKSAKLKHPMAKREDIAIQSTDINYVDEDSPGVVIVPPKEETIISIAESQPPENGLFMGTLHDVRAKWKDADAFGQSIITAKIKRDKKGMLPTLGATVQPQCATFGRIPQGLCSECSKLYHFHTSCGVSDDTARSKLPRGCRSCRLAQLHSTPPGFWDPDFLPTQK